MVQRLAMDGCDRLLDDVRIAVRPRHLNPRTGEVHVGWIRRFILCHGTRPSEMVAAEGS